MSIGAEIGIAWARLPEFWGSNEGMNPADYFGSTQADQLIKCGEFLGLIALCR